MNNNTFISNYKKCFKNYLNFKGQASNKEFWLFVLSNIIISIILSAITILIDRTILRGADYSTTINMFYYIFGGLIVLQALYILVMLIPLISVSVRVIHSKGMSGLLNLLVLIPIIGSHILLNFAVFLTMNM
jgi:uncharacterized membrane protein YhaH (DUF805 family)